MFENKVLRKIFVPKQDEVSRKYRTLHSKELNVLYRLPSIARILKGFLC